MEWFEKKKISVRQNLPWFEKETKMEYAYPAQDRQEKEVIQQHSSLHQNLESLRFSMGLPNAPVSIAKEKKPEKNLGSFFKEDKKQTPNKKSLRHFSNLTIVENTAPTILENEESPLAFEKNLDDIFYNNPYSFIRVKENFEQPPSQVVSYPHNQATEDSHSFAQQVTESVKKHFDFPQTEPAQKLYQNSFASQNQSQTSHETINKITNDFKTAFDDYLQKRESVSKNKNSLKKQYIPNKDPFYRDFLKNKTNNPFLEKLNVQDSFQYKQKLENPQTAKLQFSLQEHLSKKAQTVPQSFDSPLVQEKPAEKDLLYRNSQKQDHFAAAKEFVYRYGGHHFAQPNSPYSISLNSAKDKKKEDQKQTFATKIKQPLQSNEPATFSQDYKLKGNKDFATAMFEKKPKKQKPADHIEIKITPHRKKTEPKFDLQAEKKKLETFSFLEEAQKNTNTKSFLQKDRSEQTPKKEFDFSFDKSAFTLKDSPKETKTNSQEETKTKNIFANVQSQEIKTQETKNITFKSPTQTPRAIPKDVKEAKEAKDVKEQPQQQNQNKDEKDLQLAHENQKNLKDFLEKHKDKMDKQHNLRQSRVIINEEFHPTPAVVQPIYQWQDSVSVHSKKEDELFEDVVWRSETISEQDVLPQPSQQLPDGKQKSIATEKLTKDLSQEHSLEAIAEKKNDTALNQDFELEENEIPKQQHLQKPLVQESSQNIEPQEPDFDEEKNELPAMDKENLQEHLQEEQQDIEAVQFDVQATKDHLLDQNPNVAIQEKTAKENFPSPLENLAKEKDSKKFSQHERASITPHVAFNKQFFLKMNTLQKNKNRFVSDPAEIQEVIVKLEETLNQFNIEGRVVGIQQGPIITRYEIKIPPGIKVSRLLGLTDELAMALEAFKVRIEAPIPGRSTAGIEIPNKERQTVYLGDIINDEAYLESEAHLPLPFGKDIAGGNVITDLAKMPHLLIAGATGSGKSVAVNSFITSLILHKTPEEVRFLLIDPKLVELSHYNDIPHLLHPVITDHIKAILALNWAVEEMERRYEDLVDMRVRDIRSYNEKVREHSQGEIMPYIVVLIDELGDLMMVAGKDVESSIIRLTQKARAVGIHMILATQRPSVDVITALIKANCPARISLQVAQRTDSRTILDGNGAEQLLGKGDMLFKHPSQAQLQRIQCPYVEDYEVEEVVKQVKNIGKPSYIALDDPRANGSQVDPEDEELMDEAWEIITESQKASASYLQRRLRIGYNRAARIIEAFEAKGWIGPQMGSKPREILA